MTTRRTSGHLLATTAATGLALFALAAPASAHVGVTPSDTAAGGYAVLTVSVPHGCDGSPTTRIDIQIPKEVLSVTPTRNQYWDLGETQEKLAEPVTDAHGNTVTERDSVVTYTAKTPLPDGVRDTFELSLRLPDSEGTALVFPIVQTCAKGKTAWVEVGGDEDELEHPAPIITTTAAVEGEPGDPEQASEGANTAGVTGLVAGVLGLLAGGAALVLVRRKP